MMKLSTTHICCRKLLRILLQAEPDQSQTPYLLRRNTLSPPSISYSPDPILSPLNSSSNSSDEFTQKPFQPTNSPFDSSMALTILVLLTALFFMAFFSVYIRRFSDDSPANFRRRLRQSTTTPPISSSSSSSSTRFHPTKRGLDPSAVGSLPLIPYGARAAYPNDCAICLTEFEERETVKMIPCCRHVFHPDCIDTWLHSRVSCPLCRSTKMQASVKEEICLSVTDGDGDQETTARSTVASNDTWNQAGPVSDVVGRA